MCVVANAFALTACLLAGGTAQAHDAWTEARNDRYAVVFGHDGKIEKYSPSKVKKVAAIDAAGAPLAVDMAVSGDEVTFAVSGKPVLTLLHYDNGFWTKTATGTRNLPKNEVRDALQASHTVKYGKTVHAWTAPAGRPQGQELEIVPLASAAPVAGGMLPLQVLWQGKPLAGAKVMRIDAAHDAPVATDAQGRVSVPLKAGRQLLGVSHRKNLTNDAQADVYSVSATLVFDVR